VGKTIPDTLAKEKRRKTMTEVKKPMTVQEIRDAIAKPKVVTLPSGLVLKIRRLTPLDYLNEGLTTIPNEFFTFLVEINQGKLDLGNADENKTKKNFEIFEQFVNITLDKGVIEPKMMFKYDKEKSETHLLYSELNGTDQAMLVSEIIGKAEAK
jgi:hypothetical protein